MRPTRLERHLKQHTLILKTKHFFSAKAESLKRMKLNNWEVIAQVYRSISKLHLIAKQEKPHTIILGEDAEQKMKSTSLSNNTVKRRIDDILADIKSQIINKVKLSPFFVIICDEYTNIVNCA
ncbi:unnamed protein product [Acanthoscelides obtectus]|uniref:Uncharacterized protein n=1 Tax=Acanthoscelides obtectus TaxID=200917 RepID=A0A9P0JLB5_ACAOB|nr:unnamed protein product [Acanthoscelides obtectus]CAK1655064.1 SCAN domain-containing protein 3 [Acanthoscelides obtectus]